MKNPHNKVNGIHTVNKQTLETSEEPYNYVFQAILRSKQKAEKPLFARRTYQRKGEVKSCFNGALKPKDSCQNFTASCQWKGTTTNLTSRRYNRCATHQTWLDPRSPATTVHHACPKVRAPRRPTGHNFSANRNDYATNP